MMLPADSAHASSGVRREFACDQNRGPIAGARVGGKGIAEAVSDSSGRLILPRVPTGSRQFDVVALGRTPQAHLVQVRVRDTLEEAFVLDRVTTLEHIKTEATVPGETVRGHEER